MKAGRTGGSCVHGTARNMKCLEIKAAAGGLQFRWGEDGMNIRARLQSFAEYSGRHVSQAATHTVKTWREVEVACIWCAGGVRG